MRSEFLLPTIFESEYLKGVVPTACSLTNTLAPVGVDWMMVLLAQLAATMATANNTATNLVDDAIFFI